ncbi:hypothetical protein K501DRAFT_257006 [Backusella circina FSU 941]|nr:hypothetical protein K501DRAFT_257006 [Backusella circina FSU 941]
MEPSLTIELPIDQVAKVVKRHLVYQHAEKSTSRVSCINKSERYYSNNIDTHNAHHLTLPGGAILDDIYKWTARVERQRRKRSRSISFPVTGHHQQTLMKQPGGFRRHHVLIKAERQGKRKPNFVTGSFVEFLCLYGHFGGENLSDLETSSSEDYSLSEEEEEAVKGDVDQGTSHNVSYGSIFKRNASIHEESEDDSDECGLPPPISSHHGRTVDPIRVQREDIRLLSKSKRRSSYALQGKATPGKAMFLLLKSFVTTGIMFLPKAFYNGGLLFSIIAVICWGLLSHWSFLLLVQTRTIVPTSFGEMGGVLYGNKMRMCVLFAITLCQIGFVCAYMIFVAENLQSLVLAFSKCRVSLPMHFLILIQSFAFIPLAMIRKIQRLSVFALIADVFIVIGLVYLFYYDFKELFLFGVADIAMWNPTHFPLFIGTAAFTFEGIGLVTPITDSMKEPQKFPQVLTRALSVITVLFILMGAISYMAFGASVETIILLNLPSKDPMVSSIQTLYSLSICLSIPLQLFPAIRIMENGLFTTKSGKTSTFVKWQKNIFRVFIVFLCATIGIAGSKDKLDKFVSFLGALFCIPLCFIFPPLFHLKATFTTLTFTRKLADYLLITFGIICSSFVTFSTLTQWNSAETLDPVQQCIVHRS